MLREAKTELRRAERAVAQTRRLVAAAADALDDDTTTDTQEGHRDEDRSAAHH